VKRTAATERRRDGRWGGEILVAACACLLTMAVVGSAVYLTWRVYERHDLSQRAAAFVSSLRNRTPEELQANVARLKALPKVAKYVVPEINRSLRQAGSEEQLCASIEVAKAFVDDAAIRRRLFRLRTDGRESVAGAAVEALSWVEPPEDAARLLGECLVGSEEVGPHPAVVDEVCGGLVRLGPVGLAEMKRRLALLSAERRLWLVRYVEAVQPADRELWLDMLAADNDESVRSAALRAKASGGGAADDLRSAMGAVLQDRAGGQ